MVIIDVGNERYAPVTLGRVVRDYDGPTAPIPGLLVTGVIENGGYPAGER